jgi:hypothetical protein
MGRPSHRLESLTQGQKAPSPSVRNDCPSNNVFLFRYQHNYFYSHRTIILH